LEIGKEPRWYAVRNMRGALLEALRLECVISKGKLPTFEPCVRQWNRAVSRKYMQAYCDKLYPSGILPGEKDKLRMMLLASLLNRLVDELGRQLRLYPDNVRARCKTPFTGPTNKCRSMILTHLRLRLLVEGAPPAFWPASTNTSGIIELLARKWQRRAEHGERDE